MESFAGGRKLFDATLRLERRPLTPRNLRRALVGYPALTLRVFLWIYLQAALLKLRGAPFHSHPKHQGAPSAARAPRTAERSSPSAGDSSRAA
jgi:DUF1365 family protein